MLAADRVATGARQGKVRQILINIPPNSLCIFYDLYFLWDIHHILDILSAD